LCKVYKVSGNILSARPKFRIIFLFNFQIFQNVHYVMHMKFHGHDFIQPQHVPFSFAYTYVLANIYIYFAGFSDPYCMLGIQPSTQVMQQLYAGSAGSTGYNSGPGSPLLGQTPPMSPRISLGLKSSGSEGYIESDEGSESPSLSPARNDSPSEKHRKHYR
jgi:hypothetical protein